jgi:hypothetical protein
MTLTAAQPEPDRRAAARKRLRDAARADGLAPARIAELEGSLMAAFAIKDLMAAFGVRIAPHGHGGNGPPLFVIPGEHHAKHGAREGKPGDNTARISRPGFPSPRLADASLGRE